jgi:hypothetical protein
MVISVIAMGYSVSGGASTPGCFISAVVIGAFALMIATATGGASVFLPTSTHG